ncbi:MAG: porin family protein [Alistipes sp.]|nr:porin family protein [Alistipes sp.]
MKAEDQFKEVLQSRLRDYTPEDPAPSWQQMQRRMELYANAHPELSTPPTHRSSRRWLYAAAATLLFGVVGTTLYRMHSSSPLRSDTPSQPLTELLASTATSTPQPRSSASPQNDAVLSELLQSAKRIEIVSAGTPPAVTTLSASQSVENLAFEGTATENTPLIDGHSAASAAPSSETSTSTPEASTLLAARPARAHFKRAPQEDFWRSTPPLRRPRRSWMMTAFADASTFSAAQGSTNTPNRTSGIYDGAAVFSTTPLGSSLAGTPGVRPSMDHHFPISVGLTVRKYLTPRLGIETGLVYSFLESTAENEGAFLYRYSQKVHYLGIPLSVTYSVLDHKRFDLYFIGGFMAEKALSAKGTTRIYDNGDFVSSSTQSLTATGLMWSVHMGTGLGYNFVDRFGLYVEPEVNYYFRNDDQPLTYRTENRWNLNVRMGLRYNF